MESFKIITLIFAVAYSVTWTAISIKTNVMYMAPTEINLFMMALITGKIFESTYKAKGKN